MTYDFALFLWRDVENFQATGVLPYDSPVREYALRQFPIASTSVGLNIACLEVYQTIAREHMARREYEQ